MQLFEGYMQNNNFFKNYSKHELKRKEQDIPALPLDPRQTGELCELIKNPPADQQVFLLDLFKNRISPGVTESAKVKAEFLDEIVKGNSTSLLISKEEAIEILGTMVGGYNVQPLIDALQISELAESAIKALSKVTLVYDAFNQVVVLSKTNNAAKKVLESWANADWFKSRALLPELIKVKVFKVEGEINTDDFSPASEAWSRPDIPLHSLSMGTSRFPGGNEEIAQWRKDGHRVAFAGDVVGTGSSRKSAINSLLWHIGQDIPFIPNKRNDAIVLGGAIAPIFYNTAEDSGSLPITTDVSKIENGDVVIINTKLGEIKNENGELISTFKLSPNTIEDEFRAGGRINLIIGRALTQKARKVLEMPEDSIFTRPDNLDPKPNQAYTLAQKMVGKACGLRGVLPGTACEPKMTTVGSQDTTGPMTADELTELACLKFQAPMFMQSFCHTAAYPKPSDIKMHKAMPDFITSRGGVSLRQGDGVIHSWLNRLLIPDTVGTGGDSHTRFPMGISFPAGSGLVAFAGALGFMPLNMPESVLVKFSGNLQPGITLRDVVNAIPYVAIQQGKLTVPKKNKVNVFNGRILEFEGLENITVEQAFEITDASAERSAAAACINLSEESVVSFVKSNVALMQALVKDGYSNADTLANRIAEAKNWLANPTLLRADKEAEYAEVLEINLSEIKEPVVACPNDPDDVKLLSEVAGTKVDDVFIGSCMTNIGHFRAAAKMWKNEKFNPSVRTYLAPPTRMDQSLLKEESQFMNFSKIGARIETPGCSLCMGNQLRVPDNAVVFSTSTRNFNNRMGDGAQVYLGSAELASIISVIGKIPTSEEYQAYFEKNIKANEDEIYAYLQFDEQKVESLYQRRDI
ncbi:MAG: bifunctional aconitate hydratase 2/2-methylisocitrate dehydratase [Salinivirgaceae bacterium]|nr:bifunctional aconitate hydratase 2/2-methylisocitrate dehydratase [Salinivirgaceae bacterium]